MVNAVELRLRKEYWTHVYICLIRFHSLNKSEAMKLVSEYLKRFPISSQDPEVELIYHFEPFRLACKITGNKLSVKDCADEYSKILQIDSPLSLQSFAGNYNVEIFGTIGDGRNVRRVKAAKINSGSDAKRAAVGKLGGMKAAAKSTTKKTPTEKPAKKTDGGSGKKGSKKGGGGKSKKAH